MNKTIIYSGYLEILKKYGFLRDIHNNFLPTIYNIYVDERMLKDFNLREGDKITCEVIQTNFDDKRRETKSFIIKKILLINGKEFKKRRLFFNELTPIYPKEQIVLERKNITRGVHRNYNNISRAIDLVCPTGFGQRTLIVAPPKAGKTTILHSIALSVENNYPDVKLIILLIDERPEEVQLMKEITINSTILHSTFDRPAEEHVKLAKMCIEHAKRLVENGFKVVLLIDSLTRLVRAYNGVVPSSGRVLTGGIEPSAIVEAKAIFGAARNTIEAGSLTIMSTVLYPAISKLDEIVYTELKGTGNSDFILDQKFAEKKLFPAIDISGSSTRRYETMISGDKLMQYKMFTSKLSLLSSRNNEEALKNLLDMIASTTENEKILVAG